MGGNLAERGFCRIAQYILISSGEKSHIKKTNILAGYKLQLEGDNKSGKNKNYIISTERGNGILRNCLYFEDIDKETK